MSREQIVLEQAAEWFAALRDENAADADWRRWREWLSADPEHARAWQRVEGIGLPFRQAAGAAASASETLAKARGAGRRRMLRVLSFGGFMVGGGLLLGRELPWRDWAGRVEMAGADWRTGVGERRRLTLPDGSSLAINTASAVDVDFSRALRRIVLHAGEVLIESAPDSVSPARALVVDTRHGRLLALGTRFAIRSGAQASHAAVFEGTVRVMPTDDATRFLDVTAGHQASFSAGDIEAPSRADPWRESWSRGQIVADDMAIAEFAAELQRYTPQLIEVDAAVAALRLIGVYPIAAPARDVAAALAALEQALPVRARPTSEGGWRVTAR